ncbi:MAG TPA: hypothetical protein VI547_00435 [Anaerolineales bacterium]|nr:hypothetical protein [Anaerolineales bacterium]
MSSPSLRNLLLKAAGLFLAANLLLAATDPLPALGRLSLYNSVFPGRLRLPFGETPEAAYNFSLYQLDAMFASHEAAAPKPADEYRVILIGDSSVWGTLLTPEETLAGQINALQITTADSKRIRIYNLGYPTMSLMKDLLILDRATQYQPDLIVWLMTLESFPYKKQLDSPIVQNNPEVVRSLISKYHLSFSPSDPAVVEPSFWDRTLIGRRRALADVFRLQLYGVMWAATGIDQFYPETYELRANDLTADETFHDLKPPRFADGDLAFEVLEAGVEAAGGALILFVNEPIFMADGANSNVRYNFFYPRWAYDEYRSLWNEAMSRSRWAYVDLWNLVAPAEFTNSAVHLSAAGSAQLAEAVAAEIERMAKGSR